MTNEEKITKLTSMWYQCLIDHHKDRDCHFKITKKWSYGNKPIYCVEHWGYIYDEMYDEFETMEEAEQDLIDRLFNIVTIEARRWLAIAHDGEDDWNYNLALKYKDRFEKMLEELNELNIS